MSLLGLLVHDVTIVHPGVTIDRYNNAAKDWDDTTETVTKGWISQGGRGQGGGYEVLGDREAEVSAWILFLTSGTAITNVDRVEWNGLTFEVDGPPNPAWSPRGEHHLEIPLKVVDG